MDVLTPEDYQLLLELGGQNAQDEDQIKMILAQAEQLRAAGRAPEMRGNSRMQFAPHPLEYLGAMANQNVARQKETKATDMKKQGTLRQQQQNAMILRALTQQQQPQAPIAGQGMQLPQQPSPYSLGGQ